MPFRGCRVLVVDDERSIRFTLRVILEDMGLEVFESGDGADALALLRSPDAQDIQLVISDLKMPRLDGLGLLQALGELPNAPRLVMITAHGDERVAVEAIKRGAIDYFKKPFEADEITAVVRRSLSSIQNADDPERLRSHLVLSKTTLFRSSIMFQVAELVERVANRDITVLIQGESGTGKELLARALVEGSHRASKSFVQFNCAALPNELAEAELFGHTRGAFSGATQERTGLFREADGGTLLLDEIGELSPPIQAALLRVIQEREVRAVGADRPVPVDVRLIAATSRNLAEDPDFRKDLFFRLNVVNIHLPPLRERREDIALLAQHFAKRYAQQFGLGEPRLTASFIARLERRSWPGNIRELEHTIARALALATGPVIDEDTLALSNLAAGKSEESAEETLPLKSLVDAYERRLLVAALDNNKGNQSKTAEQLGINRATLLSKMKKYGLR